MSKPKKRKSLLAETRAAEAAERKRVAQWLAKHSGEGELPGRRSKTGESTEPEHAGLRMVQYASRPDARRRHRYSFTGPPGPGSAFSYDDFAQREGRDLENGVEALETMTQVHLLSGFGPRTPAQVELAARVDHVCTYLTNDQYELLQERFWLDGGRTLQEMADDRGVSRQAVHQRMGRTMHAFAREWAIHAGDDLEWEPEP